MNKTMRPAAKRIPRKKPTDLRKLSREAKDALRERAVKHGNGASFGSEQGLRSCLVERL